METGRIDAIRTGPGNSVQYLTFTFNTLGNLSQRVDAVAGLTDTLAYDGLNRLTQVVTSNPGLPLSLTKTVAYDSIGNITSKSDVGDYTYDPARIHAVAGIVPGATGTVTASYTYDGNGNLLTGNGRTVTWTSFDMVDEVTQGANSLTFTYDSERNRLKQVSSDGSVKYYLNDPISGIMAEKIVGASLSVTWNDYIMVGAEMVALKVSGAATQTRYFHKDHLGSITALTDETGTIAELNSFDAWGQRRNPMGPDDPLFPGLSLTSQITRGYTGHEQLDQVGLVHMNGRIYDPIIGKMMSADPTVPNPIDGQSYNRYSYVQNNPLSLTDPTGFVPDREQRNERGQFDAGRRDGPLGAKGRHDGGGDTPGGGPTAASTVAGDGSDASKFGPIAGDQLAAGSTSNQSPPITGTRINGSNCLGCGLSENFSPTAVGQARAAQLAKNRAQSVVGENATEQSLGNNVAGRQVSFKTSKGTISRADFVTKDRKIVETKTGNAKLSQNQKDLQADIEAGRAVTPVGSNATNAGLQAGQPTVLDKYDIHRPF